MRSFVLLTLTLTAFSLQAQTPASTIPVPTIRANTRMILVSVIATDKAGPVTDLTAQDFSVWENGKAQKLAAFAFERPVLSEQKEASPLPPNVYTNRPDYLNPSGPLTVLLLDALNTEAPDQTFVRRELLRYVGNQVQPGQRLAVFSLGSELHLLQDFTSDPQVLRAAVENFVPRESLELQQDNVFVPPPPREDHSTASYLVMLRAFEQLQADRREITMNRRVAKTLDAIRTIARSVAGYPGRKNLVWVSSSFPLVYQAQLGFSFETTRPVFYRTYERELRQTANIMGEAQLSIYPVDARGLVGAEVMDASKSLTDERGNANTGAELGELVNRSSDERLKTQASMEEIAHLTGGRAFINQNDIDNAVALSVADGSSYYTLAYYPTNKTWHDEFRKIRIAVARKGVQLRYRIGYYATDASHELQSRDAELVQALRSDAPPATMVIFDAKVLPEPAPPRAVEYLTRKYLIGFMVDTRTLSSEPLANSGHHFYLEFHAAAFSPDGTLAAHTDTQVDTWASPTTYEGIREDGLPFNTSLQLRPGRYQLRLVVRDIRTGYLGSVNIPLVIKETTTQN